MVQKPDKHRSIGHLARIETCLQASDRKLTLQRQRRHDAKISNLISFRIYRLMYHFEATAFDIADACRTRVRYKQINSPAQQRCLFIALIVAPLRGHGLKSRGALGFCLSHAYDIQLQIYNLSAFILSHVVSTSYNT